MTQMRKQPKWPDGNEPDRIELVSRAFMDGAGEWFHAPPGVKEAHRIDGVWCWKAKEPAMRT